MSNLTAQVLHLQGQLDRLAAHPGVQGCALVEIATGMVWYHSGRWETVEIFAEAAVEVWRVQLRCNPQFEHLGKPRTSICYFETGSMALLPCVSSVSLLMVCIADRVGMDWAKWTLEFKPFQKQLALV